MVNEVTPSHAIPSAGALVIGRLRLTLKPGVSFEQVENALQQFADAPSMIDVREVTTAAIPGNSQTVYLFIGCGWDDSEPYRLSRDVPHSTNQGVKVDLSVVTGLNTGGVCTGMTVRYPRADRYGIPEEASSLEAALTLVDANGFRVPTDAASSDGTFTHESEDSGDDSAAQIWLKIQVSADFPLPV